LLTYAGEEVAVTATKTFTSQLSLLYLLSLQMALKRGFEPDRLKALLRSLYAVPDLLRRNMKEMENECSFLAELYKDKNVYFVLGSGPNYATALEGALKLKEACNVFSEGFATREFLHGPVQLVNEKTAVMLILFKTELEEVRRLVKSFKGYGAPVIAVSNDASVGDELKAETLSFKGDVPPYISPMVYAAPLQLYAYFTSIYRGLNPDKPEKLSKVVK
jgi:glucosamine--fructose-6-phosphate aminotransferase (isomerizing)